MLSSRIIRAFSSGEKLSPIPTRTLGAGHSASSVQKTGHLRESGIPLTACARGGGLLIRHSIITKCSARIQNRVTRMFLTFSAGFLSLLREQGRTQQS